MNEPTIPNIKKVVADGFDVSVEQIDSRTRKQPIALARQTFYYYVRKVLGLKYMDMAKRFKRDHRTFIWAVQAIRDRRECDLQTRTVIEELESEFPWLRKDAA
jgi:chromosomal replication initiator protein